MGPGRLQAALGFEQLLERNESLFALEQHLAYVRSERTGQCVWVGGEAGVGKTALLRQFRELHARSLRTLWGGCEPLRTPRPLGPLVDIAEAVGGELAGLVDAAARPHLVATALLTELRGQRPTVLVIEDLHWADEATLDVLTLLATRISSVPALVLASYRDDELDRTPALRVLLGELARGPRRLRVQRLSPEGVAILAEPSGLDPAELYARTGGNPFFVTEVLAAGGERLPDTVRDAVLARAARLSEQGRRLLEVVAIVPGQTELSLLQALAANLVARLDECLASGVLSAAGVTISFRHELARLAIEEAISPARRLELHRAALDALQTGNERDFARLAHHAEAAGDREAVLKWAPRAAERAAASGSHREAAAQYERAQRFTDAAELQLRAELLSRRAEECYLTSQLDESIAAQQEALECYRQLGDQRGEGNALRVLSRLLFFAGRAAEGEALVLEAVHLLERLAAGHELAMAYANVSARRMVVAEEAEAVVWGDRALEVARTLGDTETEAYALSNIGAAEFRADPDRGRAKLEAALALARREDHEELAGLTFSRLVMFPVRYRRYDIAREQLQDALDYCSERGLDTFRLYLLGCRARLELDLGHWDEAADSAGQVLRDPRSAQLARTWSLVTLGLLRARRGDSEASAPLEEAQRMVDPTWELDRIGMAAAARAETALLAGDHDAVAQMTDAALGLALERKDAWIVGELACWRWRAGLENELAPGQASEPFASSIAGEATKAAALWREIGCPYEAALALADSDDEDSLRQALDELQALGAAPAAAIVARRLRERGVRGIPRGPRRTTRENPAGLTARELDVLALIAEGLRNAEIAQRLVVSEKTVDHHVSSILRKLDASSRGEAAAAAARLGIIPSP
jgi:DNA-binding CsgD family transcriptional regulator